MRLRENHRAAKLLFLLLILTSLACNAFAGNLEPLPDPPVIVEPTATTLSPAVMAATATLDEIVSGNEVIVSVLVDLNVRSGPGVQYERVGFLSKGTSVAAVGVDTQSGWWKIVCPAALSGDECWVSGGKQYVSVENGQDASPAVVPATPTTIPPTMITGQGWLAFVDNGELYVAGLNLEQSPPQLASDAVRVSRVARVQRFSFSADGRRIAYTAGAENANSLHTVNVDGGDHRTLVTSSILPAEDAQSPTQSKVLIHEIQWLPDASGVVFNTSTIGPAGQVGRSQEDLWQATLDGELVDVFPAGEGGGTFVFEPSGQILLSRSNELSRATLGTQGQSVILQYEPVNTASETIYYPSPQITGGGVYVAVPASDPWAAGAETNLWQVPANGSAIEIGSVADVTLGHPVVWSSDGRHASFIQRTVDSQQVTSRMVISESDGSGAIPYAGGSNPVFFAWKPEGTQFLYAGTGFYAIGQPQAPPKQLLLAAGQRAVEARWASGDDYLIAIAAPANQQWEIQSANRSGETLRLANGLNQAPAFEVWLP